MSEVCYTPGKCGKFLRLKHWKAGFSVKCIDGYRTFTGTPFDIESYEYGLRTFCQDCTIIRTDDELKAINKICQGKLSDYGIS